MSGDAVRTAPGVRDSVTGRFCTDCLPEPAVHDLPRRRDVDVPVRRLEDAGGNPGGMIVARLRRDFLAERPARRLEVEHPHHRLEQRGVHPLAAAGALALEQRDEDAVREEHARGEIGHGNADAHRALARPAGDRHEAAHALGDLVVARAIAVRARLAEARDAAVHEARVDLAQRLVVDAEAVLDVRAVVLDEDVSPRGQALEDLDATRVLEVERDRALVAVQVLKIESVAGEVVLALVLHLDHLRAHLGELPDARRSGARAREVDQRVRLERQGPVRLPVVSSPHATHAGEESTAPIAAAPSKRAFLLAAGPWRDPCPYSPRERLLWTGCGVRSGDTNTPRNSGRWR